MKEKVVSIFEHLLYVRAHPWCWHSALRANFQSPGQSVGKEGHCWETAGTWSGRQEAGSHKEVALWEREGEVHSLSRRNESEVDRRVTDTSNKGEASDRWRFRG